MTEGVRVPPPINEPPFEYEPGSRERAELKAELKRMRADRVQVPAVIGGKRIYSGNVAPLEVPHERGATLGSCHLADAAMVERAIASCLEGAREWASWPFADRASVFLRAAEILASRKRALLNAATMLGQSKTAFQSEVDAACEIVDFFRFATSFAQRIHADQPISDAGVWNRTEYRPLEGFVYAVSPFNFTAIGANLAGLPALMGCGVLWKPSSAAALSSYYVYELLEEAGLPPGVINFVVGDPTEVSRVALGHPDFAGLHFTGSTSVFQSLWRQIAGNIARYRSYPRIVGETGGKDFIAAHPSADIQALRTAIVRGAFEYQGQKCSAASRAYIPKSVWRELKGPLIEETESLSVGPPTDFRNFMGAVIHERSFRKIKGYVDRAEADGAARVIAGGQCASDEGWFVRPTIIEVNDPRQETMCEEIFGPVISVFVYPDDAWEETLDLVDSTSPYALTGAVFSECRAAVRAATRRLRHAAGNFYINDKPTGAVVAQQPFGGSRGSGTNDKAGTAQNLMRWVSPRTIKETFVPPRDYRYPFMEEA